MIHVTKRSKLLNAFKKKERKKENSVYGLTDVENRLVVAKEEREEGLGVWGLQTQD